LAAARRHLLDEALDRREARALAVHRADVDRAHAPREAPHHLAVYLGIVLAAVADEEERKLRIGVQDLADRSFLVPALHAKAEVAKKKWPFGEPLHLQVLRERHVQVPRALPDIEERVYAPGHRLVEGGDALEGLSRARVGKRDGT